MEKKGKVGELLGEGDVRERGYYLRHSHEKEGELVFPFPYHHVPIYGISMINGIFSFPLLFQRG